MSILKTIGTILRLFHYRLSMLYYRFRHFGKNYQQGEHTIAQLSKITVNKIANGKINLGKYVMCRGELYSFQGKGNIRIGDYSYVGQDARIWSLTSIDIGKRVLISHNVFIVDNKTHPVEPELRHAQYMTHYGFPPPNNMDLDPKPIIIEDDVLIAACSIILRGVRIGTGSIVAAASVVTKDVPSDVIVAGNPARIVRKLR